MSSEQIRTLKRHLDEAYFTHTVEWLTACVDWVRENFNPVTDAILKAQLFEQWQDANLEEMESRCLPANLGGQRCVKLSGKYGLQINSVEDIGESAYNQWNRLKRLENENTNVAAGDSTEMKNTWEPKPRRCLYLSFTDGTQKVFGLELSPIACLSTGIKPGTKVIVVGPVECRRGVIQLRPPNIRFIGGEVEDLIERYSVEAMLRTRLHNPPESDELPRPSAQQSIAPPETTSVSNVFRNNNNRNVEIMGEFPESLDEDEDFLAFPDDDDIFMEIDETLLISAALSNNNSNAGQITSVSNAKTQRVDSYDPVSNSSTAAPSSRNLSIPVTSPIPTISRSSNSNSMHPPVPQSKKDTAIPVKKTSRFVPVSAPTPTSSVSSTPGSSTSISRSKTKNPTSSGTLLGFKSAKSITDGSKVKKQKKIDGYMKPMPVIIDPPTPKRNKRPVREPEVIQEPEPIVDNPNSATVLSEDENDTLMDIIDGSFAAELERVENEALALSKADAEIQNKYQQSVTSLKSPPMVVVHPTSSNTKIPKMVSKHPYIFLQQVKADWKELEQTRAIVYVKACVSTVVSNIQVTKMAWTLAVTINDGTDFLNCRVASGILDKIIGFNPYEMKRMKSTKTQEARERIANGMKNLTTTLVHLNAILGIEVGPDPVIVEINDILLHHVRAVQERVSHHL